MMSNLRTDKTWNGGCETVTRTGKRSGKLCNNRFYKKKKGMCNDSCTLKSCYMHLEGDHQDVENDHSFYNEGLDDQIYSNDFDFIAPEEDGRTILVNGKVFVKKDPEFTQNVPQEPVMPNPCDDEETETESEYDPQENKEPVMSNPCDEEETESEYDTQEESVESTTCSLCIETEDDAETEYDSDAETEVHLSTSIPNENGQNRDVKTEVHLSTSIPNENGQNGDVKTDLDLSHDETMENCDKYFYYRFVEEQEKCDRFEAQIKSEKAKVESLEKLLFEKEAEANELRSSLHEFFGKWFSIRSIS